MQVDHEVIVSKLMQALPYILSVAVIKGEADVIYSTSNWDIKRDAANIISSWVSLKTKTVIVSGIEYLIRLCTKERLIATSIKGKGHIIGAKNDNRSIIVRIEHDGIIGFVYIELVKALASFSGKGSYLDESSQLEQKTQMNKDTKSARKVDKKVETLDLGKVDPEKEEGEDYFRNTASVPFTARLMAYYRAQESKRDNPLIVDTLAERLAGDLSSYLKEHIRYSEMDYPIIRSYFIEKELLIPWCNAHVKTQIVLLGAGLDTRAYRFAPLQTNNHTIFEIDFPTVINYKEKILRDEQPLCNLIRISTDISNPNWPYNLFENGFSSSTPTFWVLEGLVYYLEQKRVITLLTKIAEISAENSRIFLDVMHQSRWIPNRITRNDLLKDSFTKHFKWGLDIKNVPSFFAEVGWKISCSFADEYDQGRNVGQNGMIFIYGTKRDDISPSFVY